MAALFRIGPLHGLGHPVWIIGFLHQAIGLDAGRALARVLATDVQIGFNPHGNAVLHLNLDQVGARDALEAIGGDLFCFRL